MTLFSRKLDVFRGRFSILKGREVEKFDQSQQSRIMSANSNFNSLVMFERWFLTWLDGWNGSQCVFEWFEPSIEFLSFKKVEFDHDQLLVMTTLDGWFDDSNRSICTMVCIEGILVEWPDCVRRLDPTSSALLLYLCKFGDLDYCVII